MVCLMSKRTTESYYEVFKYIHEKILFLKGTIVTDFDRKGLKLVTDVTLLGCWFHYCQALRKKVASDFELFSLIRGNEEARIFFRKFQCLALLPADKIESASIQLAYKAMQQFPQFKRFVAYYDRQWIKREKPTSFSVFLQVVSDCFAFIALLYACFVFLIFHVL